MAHLADNSLDSTSHVLVVGAGCTGALTAAFVRKEALRRGRRIEKLCVWEWGRGPAGRMSSFWAEVDGQRILADVGAQVISIRSNELLPSWLSNLVVPAAPGSLACTDEREENWCHFFAPAGLPALQRASLEESQPEEVHFNRRLLDLSGGSSRSWRVGYAAQANSRRANRFEEFDVVVFAGTAVDASNLEGVRSALLPAQLHMLKSVMYDHRVCLTLILEARLASNVDALCQGKCELASVDSGPIGLITRQDCKGREASDAAFAISIHGTTAFAAQNLRQAKNSNVAPSESGKNALLEHFSRLLFVPLQSLRSGIIDSKTVHWRQCQVRQPAAHQASSMPCLVAGLASSLVLAGDYLASLETAGSFEGCLDSARASACAVLDILHDGQVSTNSSAAAHIDGTNTKAGRWKKTGGSSQEVNSRNTPDAGKSRRWVRKGKGKGKTDLEEAMGA